jgi:hypothetical protein
MNLRGCENLKWYRVNQLVAKLHVRTIVRTKNCWKLYYLCILSVIHFLYRCQYVSTIGKTALFEPQPSLEDSTSLHPVFASLDFATLIFLQSKVFSLASKPQPGGPGPCIYVRQWQGGPVIYPQALGSLFVAFYDSQGYGGGILTHSQRQIVWLFVINKADRM